MRFERELLTVALMVAVVTLAGSPGLSQQDRNFSARYDLADVVDLGGEVALTFTVEVSNHSQIDAFDANLVFEDSLDPESTFGDLWLGFVGSRERASTSGGVTVSKWQYDGWSRGAAPRMRIEFSDAAGESLRAHVELIRKPAAGEEGS